MIQGGNRGGRQSRREFLEWALSEERDFLSSGKSGQVISFIPIPALEGYLAGFFAREKDVSARPRKGDTFPVVNHENWELALFVIDIDPASQIAWMQIQSHVGSPKGVIEAFFQGLPKGSQFRAAVRYMDSENTYWAAIDEHRDRITKLTFEFLPPNALNGRDAVQNFVRRAQQSGNPASQKHIYKSPPGQMDPSSEILEGSAEVALEGAGEASVHVGKNKVWSSSGGRTTDEIEEEIMPTVEKPEFIKAIINRLFKWRSKDDG